MELVSSAILIYFLVVSATYLFLFLLSFQAIVSYHLRERFATPNEILKTRLTPPISVILPAYNEGKTIVASINSTADLEYPEVEILVVNDGSTDNTLNILKEQYKLVKTNRIYHQVIGTKNVKAIYRSPKLKNLVVVDKENGGKADSLNVGINISTYPLFCSLDADSILEKYSLLGVAHPFMEAYSEMVAVGGIVRAANACTIVNGQVIEARTSGKWLVNFQIVEYLRAFLSGRMGWSMMNCLLVISGAFGVFKKAPVQLVGGYRTDIVGEDMELVVRLHRYYSEIKVPAQFKFIPNPVCWTEVPESWKILIKQRNRWQRGLAESLWYHLRMLFNPKYGGKLGFLAMPYFVFVECLSPVVEMIGYWFFFLAIITGAVGWAHFYVFLLLAMLLGVLFSLLAILMEEVTQENYVKLKDLFRMILSGVLENFGYRQILSFVRAKGLLDFLQGKKAWGSMERTGF